MEADAMTTVPRRPGQPAQTICFTAKFGITVFHRYIQCRLIFQALASGLPDGIFLDQKSQLGYILDGIEK
jgi:hypothetical protein